MFTIFAGIYYWFPKMTGRMYDERLGKLHFWLTFISFNVTFFPMHWVGLRGMPRRVSDYSAEFGDLNLIISIASFVLGASVVIFLYNMITSWARGPIAGSNPWGAMTLEWQVTSPPPVFNFDEIPQVVGRAVRVRRPGARHAVLTGGAALAARSRRTDEARVLVVANETLVGQELVDAVKRRADDPSVVAPVNEPRPATSSTRTPRAGGGRRSSERSRRSRQGSGARRRLRPIRSAVKDILAQEHYDELIVSTHPETKSGWLRRDLVEEIRRAARPAPVEHVVSTTAASTGERARPRQRDRARRAAARRDPPAPREGPRAS